MARGPKKHLKRLNAPKSWMLDKLGGTFAPRPSTGPHKLRESLPLLVILRNRLKYALNGAEVKKIVMSRAIKVDGKVRTDATFPAGFMDVLRIEKTNDNFRILYDVKGRFILHKISPEEAGYKLLRVRRVQLGAKGIPYLVTHDGRTIRYPDPNIKVHDTIRYDLTKGKILENIRFETGNLCMVTGGHNLGRVGIITSREKASWILRHRPCSRFSWTLVCHQIELYLYHREGNQTLDFTPERKGSPTLDGRRKGQKNGPKNGVI